MKMITNLEIFVLVMAVYLVGVLVGVLIMWAQGWQIKLEEHKKGLDKWLAGKKE